MITGVCQGITFSHPSIYTYIYIYMRTRLYSHRSSENKNKKYTHIRAHAHAYAHIHIRHTNDSFVCVSVRTFLITLFTCATMPCTRCKKPALQAAFLPSPSTSNRSGRHAVTALSSTRSYWCVCARPRLFIFFVPKNAGHHAQEGKGSGVCGNRGLRRAGTDRGMLDRIHTAHDECLHAYITLVLQMMGRGATVNPPRQESDSAKRKASVLPPPPPSHKGETKSPRN